MKFKMPEARRERMEELLEYLGDTSQYSEYYDGNRAEDFKKCFDIESGWCWKYADLVLRGMEQRELEYAEGHHVVPASFYGKRDTRMSDEGNLTVLSYGEHLFAHFCAAKCATGSMAGKMANAFMLMYYRGKKGTRPVMPSERSIVYSIPEMEVTRIRSMVPLIAKVDAEGRSHSWEGNYWKDYYEANREDIVARSKAYYEEHREESVARKKAYSETHREDINAYQKVYRDTNKEKIAAHDKAYRESNREEIAAHKKAYYEANKEKICARNRAYYEANKEEMAVRNKAYREAHKEDAIAYQKAYREAHKEDAIAYQKAYREAKIAAGYKSITDKTTGKRKWVFVGPPEQEVAA